MAQKDHYDIIFTDHMMPGMDGIEATQKLRSMDGYLKTVPIIALTANAVLDVRDSFAKAGMNDFVAKPIDFRTICMKIRKWLPEEKILLSEKPKEPEPKHAAEEIQLPEIAGLDVREGIKNSGSPEMFFKMLGEFYKLIDTKASKIEQCLAEGMIRDYTIEVHGLKTASRTIGASELSEFFRQMEQSGNAEDHETLERETPKLLEMYRSYKEILEPYGRTEDKQKQTVSSEELMQILQDLCEAVDSFELDRIDKAYDQLESCSVSDDLADLMGKLRVFVADVAMEDIVNTCHVMMEHLKNSQA